MTQPPPDLDNQQKMFKALIPGVSGILAIVLIVVSFAVVLSTHKNTPARGTVLGNPTLAVTVLSTTPTSGYPDSSPTPGLTPSSDSTPTANFATSAEISLLRKTDTFTTGQVGSGLNVLIDPNPIVRIATDGTGQVSGYFHNFQVEPGNTDEMSNQQRPADFTNGAYNVPSNCATDPFNVNLAHENAGFAIEQALLKYQSSTNNDAMPFSSYIGATIITTRYNDVTVTCSPAPGFTKATPFNISLSMTASAQIPMFNNSSVTAYRKQQAIAAAPPNFEFAEINGCGAPFIKIISSTSIDDTCDAFGLYHWKWTSQNAKDLASKIAKETTANAANALRSFPGSDIDQYYQEVQFKLIGGINLPSDPNKIVFKVYDHWLNGLPDGTPTVYP